jgi:hypothetical protein
MNKDGPLNPFAFGKLLVHPGDIARRIIGLQKQKEISGDNFQEELQADLCNQVILFDTILDGYPKEVSIKIEELIKKLRCVCSYQEGLEITKQICKELNYP